MAEPLISDVSDTARWMAAYRAAETSRRDAVFRDHLADRFAGERGRAIAGATPRIARSGWWLVARTKAIDDLVAESVRAGYQRIVNLAAGFDTRPYRLDLPAGLEWIEADKPALMSEKQRLLAGETPRCRLSQVAVDLADAPSRQAFLADAVRDTRDVLVLTEGLLLYLSAQQVAALADDLRREEIGSWLTDLMAPALVRRMMRRMPALASAPMQFEPTDGVAFFEHRGWTVRDIRSITKEAGRLDRLPVLMRPLARLPDPDPRKLKRAPWSAVIRLI